MHSNGKGISDSALPFKRTASSWLKTSAEEIVKNASHGPSPFPLPPPFLPPLSHLVPPQRLTPITLTTLPHPLVPPPSPLARPSPCWFAHTSPAPQVVTLAKKGLQPSQIGVLLRDELGVAQVKAVTGKKILRVLKAQGCAPSLPEDLYHLIKKAVSVRKHLERNRNDKDSKFRLILIESRIHRIAR